MCGRQDVEPMHTVDMPQRPPRQTGSRSGGRLRTGCGKRGRCRDQYVHAGGETNVSQPASQRTACGDESFVVTASHAYGRTGREFRPPFTGASGCGGTGREFRPPYARASCSHAHAHICIPIYIRAQVYTDRQASGHSGRHSGVQPSSSSSPPRRSSAIWPPQHRHL